MTDTVLKATTRWNLRQPAPPDYLATFRHLPPVIAHLLYHRNIATPKDAQAFFDAGVVGDPLALNGMEKAVIRILRALLSGETIGIYGDFDADGVTSTALLIEAFRQLECKVVPYIPHRVDEGHGLNAQALKLLKEKGCTVVITADCGITGIRDGKPPRGMDLIITDHHLPSGEAPDCYVAINAHLADSGYEHDELTGVGIAYKLVQAVYGNMGKPLREDWLSLVALGTIADLGELKGENRYFVRKGLEALAHSTRPGILALAEVARIDLPRVTAEDVGYGIAPRLNAAGRLDSAMLAFRLLMTESMDEARELAAQLEGLNKLRRELTQQMMDVAEKQLQEMDREAPFILVGSDELPPGIAGLVAGRLSEQLRRPVLVYRTGPDFCVGSGRSIPEFDITAALRTCDDLLVRYGGHLQAAGFTVATANMPQLKERLLQIAAQSLAGKDLRPGLDVEVETPVSVLPGAALGYFRYLAPFGQGNPSPTFLTRRMDVVDSRLLGDGRHLRLKVREKGAVWDAVAFNHGHRWSQATGPLDIVYNVRMDNYKGRSRLELGVLDFAPSQD